MSRANNRANNEVRTIQVTPHFFNYAAGSVLFELGKTRVACAVSLNNGVPSFLRSTGAGWLTASYALLPMATAMRTERESVGKRHDRSIEISRLIGRSLRSVVSLKEFGEKTIHVDCDILQADGGTRTAAITAAGIALKLAELKWLSSNEIAKPFLTDEIGALSVAMINEALFLDPDYAEDAQAEADFNFVMNKFGDIIEIQGTAEQKPMAWEKIQEMKLLAHQGIINLLNVIGSSKQSGTIKEIALSL